MNNIRKAETPTIFYDINGIKDILIDYMVNDINGYQCHIFTLKNITTEYIENNWNSITSNIALYFQSKLKVEVEMYNIYIIFFTPDVVPKEIKYKIEQDKFCCRKFVEDRNTLQINNDIDLIQYIENSIFKIEVPVINQIRVKETETNFLKNTIKEIDDKLYNVLKDSVLSQQRSKLMDKYLEIRN